MNSQQKLRIENLEDRNLMAASIFHYADDAAVVIGGTNGDDGVAVLEEGDHVIVRVTDIYGNLQEQSFDSAEAEQIFFFGFGGDDVFINLTDKLSYVEGGEGSDFLYGGSGTDYLLGGAGMDVIYGAGGTDWLEGNEGNDQIAGASGNDVIYGGDGHDFVYGGGGNDWISGGDGNDSISGESGNDSVFGGAGHDLLTGGSGNDSLQGDSGMDILLGDSGTDRLYGGSGNDYVFWDAYDYFYGKVDGGSGTNSYYYNGTDQQIDAAKAIQQNMILSEYQMGTYDPFQTSGNNGPAWSGSSGFTEFLTGGLSWQELPYNYWHPGI